MWAVSSEVRPPRAAAGHPEAPSMINTTYFTGRPLTRSRVASPRAHGPPHYMRYRLPSRRATRRHTPMSDPARRTSPGGAKGADALLYGAPFAFVAMVDGHGAIRGTYELRLRLSRRRPGSSAHRSRQEDGGAGGRPPRVRGDHHGRGLRAGPLSLQGRLRLPRGARGRPRASCWKTHDEREAALRAIVAKYDPSQPTHLSTKRPSPILWSTRS